MMRQGALFITGMLLQLSLLGQAGDKMTREEYISAFANLAMQEMARVGIPASIKLAQGCLESENGNSRLAVRANNHFGIKCHDWSGKKIYHHDDRWRECFRSYPSVYDSYMDHSLFLTTKPRYASLFQLDPDDYRGWSRGLKKAGYATAPDYASLLIRIIEENELYRYDEMVLAGKIDFETDTALMAAEDRTASSRQILTNNRIEYVVVRPGDTPESLRNELDLYPKEIFRYNNLSGGAKLEPGQVIYLQPKRRKAERGNEVHVVKAGETMYDISQIYGVKLKHLYRMNLMSEGDQPSEGDQIHLRKKKREPLLRLEPVEEPHDQEEMRFRF